MRRMITGAVAVGSCLVAVTGCTSNSHTVGAGRTLTGSGSTAPATTSSTRSGTAVPVRTTSTAAVAPTDSATLISYVRAGRLVEGAQYQYGAAGSGQPMQPTRGAEEFTTPSGIITCGFFGAGSSVTCSVTHYTYPTPPRPSSCHLNYAAGWVSLSASGVNRSLCLGGPPFPPVGRALPYGSTLAQGPMACRSDAAFLACVDSGSGHGFVVNRDELRTY